MKNFTSTQKLRKILSSAVFKHAYINKFIQPKTFENVPLPRDLSRLVIHELTGLEPFSSLSKEDITDINDKINSDNRGIPNKFKVIVEKALKFEDNFLFLEQQTPPIKKYDGKDNKTSPDPIWSIKFFKFEKNKLDVEESKLYEKPSTESIVETLATIASMQILSSCSPLHN